MDVMRSYELVSEVLNNLKIVLAPKSQDQIK